MPQPLLPTPPPIPQTIPQAVIVPLAWTGDLLIYLRKERGLSQQQLADRLGMPQQSIGRWESERFRGTSLENLLQVAQALGADIRLTTYAMTAMTDVAENSANEFPNHAPKS